MSETRQYQTAEQRRDRAVAAVVELSATENPAGLTTARIARRMRLSEGALFRHFPNKDALWEAVAGWVAGQLTQRVAAVADDAPDPLAGLEAMFLAHIDFIARHPGVPRLMLGELQKPAGSRARKLIERAMGEYRERVQRLLRAGMEQGRVRADLDPAAAAVLYLGAVQGLVVQSLVGGGMQAAVRAAPGVFRVFHNGIVEREA